MAVDRQLKAVDSRTRISASPASLTPRAHTCALGHSATHSSLPASLPPCPPQRTLSKESSRPPLPSPLEPSPSRLSLQPSTLLPSRLPGTSSHHAPPSGHTRPQRTEAPGTGRHTIPFSLLLETLTSLGFLPGMNTLLTVLLCHWLHLCWLFLLVPSLHQGFWILALQTPGAGSFFGGWGWGGGVLSCAAQIVQEHLWTPPTRCQQHIPIMTTASPDIANAPWGCSTIAPPPPPALRIPGLDVRALCALT